MHPGEQEHIHDITEQILIEKNYYHQFLFCVNRNIFKRTHNRTIITEKT